MDTLDKIVEEDPEKAPPAKEAELLKSFARFVQTQPGEFPEVLAEWISERREAGLPLDPDAPDRRSPPRDFRKKLGMEFLRVRAEE